MATNIIAKCNDALWDKTFAYGLASYTQSNCQVTLTDDGYRIYRPANLVYPDCGNTVWGGLVLKPFNADSNALQKNHSYILRFELKGKTSNNVSDIYFTNQAGWGGGGLDPQPTNVQYTPIGTNWTSDEWVTFQYRFTITDDIYKVCTRTYSIFVEGETYLSYRDFKFGFGYTSTGEMGTDLYLRNFKLYDITTPSASHHVTKQGLVTADNFTENPGNASLKYDGDNYANQFYEL